MTKLMPIGTEELQLIENICHDFLYKTDAWEEAADLANREGFELSYSTFDQMWKDTTDECGEIDSHAIIREWIEKEI